MNKSKTSFLFKYFDLFLIFSLVIIIFLLTLLFSSHLGNIIVDFGREAYIPEEMLSGKILYKDIFNIFGPLSYQINAILYAIFGINLKTLYFAGFVNASLIISVLYFLSRLFTSKGTSWIICFFIISSCFFNPNVFNYIASYSYAITYAFSSFLCSTLFLILYLKTSKDVFLSFSWFFIGISFATKYEYFPYLLFLLIITLIKKPSDKKYFIVSFVSFLIIPFISLSVLFLQGLNIHEFLQQIKLIKNFSFSPSLNYFYSNNAGLYPKRLFWGADFYVFKNEFIYAGGLLTFLYLFFTVERQKYLQKFLCLILILFCGYKCFYFLIFSSFIFCWLPLSTLILFIILTIKYKHIIFKNILEDNIGIYLIFILIALLASIKSFFFLNFFSYGVFALPLLFMVNSIFITEYLPKWFNFLDKSVLEKSFIIIVLGASISYLGKLHYNFKNDFVLSTNKGIIYDKKDIVTPTRELINYIDKNLKPNDSILIIPEGIMVNFLTSHPTKTIYYSTMTPYIETFGEDKIIKDIEKEHPEYIVINNRLSPEYNYKYICTDYGFQICKYVETSYSKVTSFGKQFKLTLFKLK